MFHHSQIHSQVLFFFGTILLPVFFFLFPSAKEHKNHLSLNTSVSKFSLWHLFNRANPFVDACDKPSRDIRLESAAFSFSQTNKHTSMLFKATDSSHHHPSSFSRPWHSSPAVSHPLIPRSWQSAAAARLQPCPSTWRTAQVEGGGGVIPQYKLP